MTVVLMLAGVGIIAVSAAVIFASLVIGIRRGDRGHLANAAKTNPDAFARHLLVGVRYPARNVDGEDE